MIISINMQITITTPITTSKTSLYTIYVRESSWYLRIGLQHDKIDVPDQTGQDKCDKDESRLRGLRLVALAATVQAEVGHGRQQEDSDLFKLKVAIWVNELVLLVV